MNIYVGNLAYEVTAEDLRQAFSEFGQVDSAAVIKDKVSGKSRGFGFVEMTDAAEGEAAIVGLNGRDLKGRALRVNEARPKPQGERAGGGGYNRSSSRSFGGPPRRDRDERSGGNRY
jgi:RNA recognition motif-containing protein